MFSDVGETPGVLSTSIIVANAGMNGNAWLLLLRVVMRLLAGGPDESEYAPLQLSLRQLVDDLAQLIVVSFPMLYPVPIQTPYASMRPITRVPNCIRCAMTTICSWYVIAALRHISVRLYRTNLRASGYVCGAAIHIDGCPETYTQYQPRFARMICRIHACGSQYAGYWGSTPLGAGARPPSRGFRYPGRNTIAR
jgi:hypothetical protein